MDYILWCSIGTVLTFLDFPGPGIGQIPAVGWWKPQRVLTGMKAGHVDDFLFGGPAEKKDWQKLERKIKEHYTWSEWEARYVRTVRSPDCGRK